MKKFLAQRGYLIWMYVGLVLGIFVVYHPVFRTFYQQDEWQTLGHNIIEGWGILTKDLSIVRIFFAEGRILSRFFYFIFLGIYQYNVTPVFLFAMVSHALNAWLVYLLVGKYKGGWVASVSAAAFFAVNSVSDETLIWVSAISTIPATTLLLVSILWYMDFLESGNTGKRNLSFIVGILSLFIKETGLFIFPFYPILYAYWRKTINIKKIISVHVPLLLYGIVLVIFRLSGIFLAPRAAGFVDQQTGGFLFPVIYHSIVYPLTSFFQVFVPPLATYAFVPTVVRSEYPYLLGTPLFDLAGQSAVADVVSLVGTIIFSAIIGFMVLRKTETEGNKRLVFISLLLFGLSFLPYAVLHRYFSYFSSRYYYVGVIGAAWLFGYAVSWLYKRLPWVASRVLLLAAVGLYLVYHVQAIRKDLDWQVAIASERKIFLKEVKRLHPDMKNQTVFYITSDKKYLGEITYPFQNGLGYILEVLYYDTGKIPKSFLASNFLWDLGSEGFREIEGASFGYFEHVDKLGELVKEGKVSPDIVYGYFYNSQAHTLSDVTKSVREKLATLSGTLR